MGPSYKGHVHGQLNKKQVEKRIATLERTLKQQTQELERMKRRSKGRKRGKVTSQLPAGGISSAQSLPTLPPTT